MTRHGTLVLGTAQLGLQYGKVNASQPPDETDAHQVLETAWSSGFTTLDTARAYGIAEERIGSWLKSAGHRPRIITKCRPLPATDDENALSRELNDSFSLSMATLGVGRVEAFLVHRSEDIFRRGVMEALLDLKAEGRIGGVGASVYEPREVARLLDVEGVTDIQAPLSLFDQRLVRTGLVEAARKRGVRIWARSLFLQGVLFLEPEVLPPFLAPLAEPLRRLARISAENGVTLASLAMHAVAAHEGVAGLVMGAHTAGQVHGLAHAYTATVPDGVAAAAMKLFEDIPETVIDPRTWPGTHGVAPA